MLRNGLLGNPSCDINYGAATNITCVGTTENRSPPRPILVPTPGAKNVLMVDYSLFEMPMLTIHWTRVSTTLRMPVVEGSFEVLCLGKKDRLNSVAHNEKGVTGSAAFEARPILTREHRESFSVIRQITKTCSQQSPEPHFPKVNGSHWSQVPIGGKSTASRAALWAGPTCPNFAGVLAACCRRLRGARIALFGTLKHAPFVGRRSP